MNTELDYCWAGGAIGAFAGVLIGILWLAMLPLVGIELHIVNHTYYEVRGEVTCALIPALALLGAYVGVRRHRKLAEKISYRLR